MLDLQEVEARLARAGFHNRFWGRAEVRELQHILMPNEEISAVANGRYENGFAMIVATDRRLLLIDRKMFFMSIEDIRYDMISEIDFYAHVLDATVAIKTINAALVFKSIRQQKLRRLCGYVQHKVMEIRERNLAVQEHIVASQAYPAGQSVQLPAQQVPFSDYPSGNGISYSPQAAQTQLLNGYGQLPGIPLTTIRRRPSKFFVSPSKP